MTVIGVIENRAPVAADDSYTTVGDGHVFRAGAGSAVGAPSVLANDSDPDGNVLTAELVSQPSNGSVAMDSDGSFTYTPNPDFVGVDTFVYQAFDGVEATQATVSINVELKESVRFVAVEDAMVDDDDSGRNFGNDPELFIYHEVGTDRDDPKWGYLKFDLSQFTAEVDRAQLELTPTQFGGGDKTLYVFAVDDDSWSEDAITWANQPASGGQIGSTTVSAGSVNGRVAADITAYVRQALAVGRDSLSLRIAWWPNTQNFGSQDATGRFASSEHANRSYWPRLTVDGRVENRTPSATDDSYRTIGDEYIFQAGSGSKIPPSFGLGQRL